MKVMASSSKTLSFRKPAAGSSSPKTPSPKSEASSSSPKPPSPVDGTSVPVVESFDELTAGEQSAAQMGTVPAS